MLKIQKTIIDTGEDTAVLVYDRWSDDPAVPLVVVAALALAVFDRLDGDNWAVGSGVFEAAHDEAGDALYCMDAEADSGMLDAVRNRACEALVFALAGRVDSRRVDGTDRLEPCLIDRHATPLWPMNTASNALSEGNLQGCTVDADWIAEQRRNGNPDAKKAMAEARAWIDSEAGGPDWTQYNACPHCQERARQERLEALKAKQKDTRPPDGTVVAKAIIHPARPAFS